MDTFGWDNPPIATSEMNFPPCMWSNQQNAASENSTQSSVDYSIVGSVGDLTEAFLNSSEVVHGVKTCEPSELGGVSQATGLLLPPSQPESVSSTSAVEVSQPQDALWLAAAAELTTLETGTPWGDALASLGHLTEHFGLTKEALQVHINVGDDEDVSAILSNCDNTPNYQLSCSGNVSSGESENCSSLMGTDKGSHHHCSNVEEVVSQRSSNPDATRLMPSQSRSNLKRKQREIDECAAGEGSLYRDVLQSDSSTEGGFRIVFENQSKWKKPRSDKYQQRTSSIDFQLENGYEPDAEAIAQVKEMIYRAAAMRPVSLGAMEAVERPKRKNVRISSDPQTVAARHRRERISERLRVLQRLVPGGSKMDTASMLDEAANYLKFLKSQVGALETLGQGIGSMTATNSSSSLPLSLPFNQSSFPMQTFQPQMQTLVHGHPQKATPTRAPSHLHF